MLFIWSGWGIVVIPVVIGTAVAVGALGGSALRALGHPELTFLAVSLGLFAAAAANWIVGRRLNGRPPRELIDPATNQRVLLRRRHALFWVPVQYWSVPVALAALVPLLALRNL
ncbi:MULTISPECIES: hypothetical protein [Methylobacterium]|jgi:hypothetical protein|uniref:Integral membrane protein n=1 Tax=Methylobacterium longum TaxID=767694 RepID=A0ABT8AZ47_9HYPH|nr:MULTISPECIES: hypothetical protein [Methylobacterium]MCJ2099590.1 hypothetical protein [Methylobacterium sp. E-046]MDN3574696.1 hypothetical protein [Methylobacterium longum]GJE13613.1 hypothetical protein FOHLNKBM_4677 [Methylobacterium longum]